MSAHPRKRVVPSRRRPQDDGEEELSLSGEVEDDSLSEGSALSNEYDDADGAGSEASVEEKEGPATSQPTENKSHQPLAVGPQPDPVFRSTADTQAMLNGLKASGAGDEAEEIHFEDFTDHHVTGDKVPSIDEQAGPHDETPAERSKREHQEYIKERDSNPAFVPNRGGFFLHDDRSGPANGHAVRGHGRPRGPLGSFPQG